MASSTPTKDSHTEWLSLRQETKKEIMNTDVLCEILFQPGQEKEAEEVLAHAFAMFRLFEERFSRFRNDNELWAFNHSTKSIVSQDLFELLTRAQSFYRSTEGLFNPSILPALENAGYRGAYTGHSASGPASLETLVLDQSTHTVTKPVDLFIDLGGIGKGYIVDQVSDFLHKKFPNVLVDAGGDIAAYGSNRKENYEYWAIEVEHPLPEHPPIAILLLHDQSVATSGRNRRHWQKAGHEYHHLIDPRTSTSATPDFLSVTVIAPDTTTADVLAKSLFIAGKEKGQRLAEVWHMPVIFAFADGTANINKYAEPYVWKV